MTRKLKDGWIIHNEWVELSTDGMNRRTHWVATNCSRCKDTVILPLSELVREGPGRCDGCDAYQAHLY